MTWKIAFTLPISMLLSGYSVPPEQASPPALGGLPYTPHCTQLDPVQYVPDFYHWGPTINSVHQAWYEVPQSWDVISVYQELEAAGLCVTNGVSVPFQAAVSRLQYDPYPPSSSDHKTPEEMLRESITPDPEKVNPDNGFHPALFLFIVVGIVGWRWIGRVPTDEETISTFLKIDQIDDAIADTHSLVTSSASVPTAPPVSESPHNAQTPQETAGDSSRDSFGRQRETAPGDRDRQRLERTWEHGSADTTEEIRNRVLTELEANYQQKPHLNIQGLSLADFKKRHCQTGGKFDIDKVEADTTGELEEYATGRAYGFLEKYHPHYIKHLVWWVFGLQQKGDDGSPSAQRYQRSKAFCEQCIEDWKTPPF